MKILRILRKFWGWRFFQTSDAFLLSLLSGLSESFLSLTNLLFENMARKAWGHKLQLRLCIVLSPWKVPHSLQIAIWKHVDTKVWVICWTNKLAAEAWVAPPQRRCGSSKPQLLLNEQQECVSGADTTLLLSAGSTPLCCEAGEKQTLLIPGAETFSANFQLRNAKDAQLACCQWILSLKIFWFITILVSDWLSLALLHVFLGVWRWNHHLRIFSFQ